MIISNHKSSKIHSIKCPLRHDPMKNTIFQCNFCLFCSFFLWSFVNAILRHWQGTHDNKLIIEYFFSLYLKESVGEWKFCVRVKRRNQLNLMTWKRTWRKFVVMKSPFSRPWCNYGQIKMSAPFIIHQSVSFDPAVINLHHDLTDRDTLI